MSYKELISLILITTFLVVLSGCSGLINHYSDKSEITASSVPVSFQPESINEETIWKELYADELKKHIDFDSPKFNICDLDRDGTPELLISDDQCHGANVEIFTIYNGELYDLGYYGSWGEVSYDPVSKYISSVFGNQVITFCNVYILKNGKMVEIASFYDNEGDTDAPKLHFEVNNKTVTEDEYQTEWVKYNSNHDRNGFARKYDINESEILRVIGS